jgi:hypothetical protein
MGNHFDFTVVHGYKVFSGRNLDAVTLYGNHHRLLFKEMGGNVIATILVNV